MASKGPDSRISLVIDVEDGREDLRAAISQALGVLNLDKPTSPIMVADADVWLVMGVIQRQFPDLEIDHGRIRRIDMGNRPATPAIPEAPLTVDSIAPVVAPVEAPVVTPVVPVYTGRVTPTGLPEASLDDDKPGDQYAQDQQGWAELGRKVSEARSLAAKINNSRRGRRQLAHRVTVPQYSCSFEYRGQQLGITKPDGAAVTLEELRAWKNEIDRNPSKKP
jgi:hypothetical protein